MAHVPHRRNTRTGFPCTRKCRSSGSNRPALDGPPSEKPQVHLANRNPVQARDPHWIAASLAPEPLQMLIRRIVAYCTCANYLAYLSHNKRMSTVAPVTASMLR